MKEKIWNKSGMKMINFESANKTFNKYIVSVSHGNVIGGGQYSSFIRPYSAIKCNNQTFDKGHLRQFDLKHFSLSYDLKKWIEERKELNFILYEFYHYRKGKRIIHGHIVQDVKNPFEMQTWKNPFMPYKSQTVLNEAKNFLA
jgi:hypothetical protein